MCIFRDEIATKQEGLLTLDQFPLPLPEENLGGDVIIGWREWYLNPYGQLRSPLLGSTWNPEKPLEADLPISTQAGVSGIHAYETPQTALDLFRSSVFGKVALFGEVLSFEQSKQMSRRGSMGQYAYPLDIYARPLAANNLMKTFGKMGVNIWQVAGWNPTWKEIEQMAEKL